MAAARGAVAVRQRRKPTTASCPVPPRRAWGHQPHDAFWGHFLDTGVKKGIALQNFTLQATQ